MTSVLSLHAPPGEIARELDRDEHLLWIGQPRRGVFLRAPDLFLVPFSLLWGGFALFWEWQVLHTPNAPAYMALFGLPFVLFGIDPIAGRFFVDARLRARARLPR
jgi:hypothetical protein